MAYIYHITTHQEWITANRNGVYRADTLITEGFIHASNREQIERTANVFFNGQRELVLLCIDCDRLQAPLKHEDLMEENQFFPHIYGELNLSAVIQVVPLESDHDGIFRIPFELV
jgi:uncharacterized protein (DUF952 family)